MTEIEIIRCITNTPKYCNIPIIQEMCARKQLEEYKREIRANAIDEFCNALCSNGIIADFMKDYIRDKGEELKQQKQ